MYKIIKLLLLKMNFFHSTAFTIGLSKKSIYDNNEGTPGPGSYTPLSNLRSIPQWKIGTEKRGKLNMSYTPGVGKYNVTSSSSFINGPKYTMKAKNNNSTNKDESPGPADYFPKEKNESPKYSMRPKHSKIKIEITPGPCDYNNETDCIVHNIKFGKDKRTSKIKNTCSPGPGKYEYKVDALNRTIPQITFTKEIRKEHRANSNSPGPGAYEYKEYIGKESPQISMSMKYLPINKANSSIGPGKYNSTNMNYYRFKSPSYKIGTALLSKKNNITITSGPGKYSPESSRLDIRSRTPTWKIGTGKRPELIFIDTSLPGVGAYTLSKSTRNGPKYSMGGKLTYIGYKNLNPGPGAYDGDELKYYIKNPSWTISTTPRGDNIKQVIKQNIPGVGAYNIDGNNTKIKMSIFGKEKRSKEIIEETPGPGQYHIPCSIVDVNNYTRKKAKYDNKYKFI